MVALKSNLQVDRDKRSSEEILYTTERNNQENRSVIKPSNSKAIKQEEPEDMITNKNTVKQIARQHKNPDLY